MNPKLEEALKEAQRELGRQGGLKTKKKYGKEHYQKLAENMNHIRQVKTQQRIAEDIGDTLKVAPTQGPKKTQGVKQKPEIKKSSLNMEYEP